MDDLDTKFESNIRKMFYGIDKYQTVQLEQDDDLNIALRKFKEIQIFRKDIGITISNSIVTDNPTDYQFYIKIGFIVIGYDYRADIYYINSYINDIISKGWKVLA